MPGKTLNVSVRSTSEDSDTVVIDRSDAELLLSSNSPMVLAIVQRMPLGQAGKVGIKFLDEQFIKELDVFLRDTAKTHTMHFSQTVTEPGRIRDEVDRLFQHPYRDMIARLRTEIRLKDFMVEPHAEILHSAYGTVAFVHSKDFGVSTNVSERVDVTDALQGIGVKVVFTSASLMPTQQTGVVGTLGNFSSPMSGECSTPSRGEAAHELDQTLDVLAVIDQIHAELSMWNYHSAFTLADGLERVIHSDGTAIGHTMARTLFLLARVHVIRAERESSQARDNIDLAKSLLAEIESTSIASGDAEVQADVVALRGAIENLEAGPDAALAHLDKCTDPYAIRIRLAILLNKQALDGAVALIEGLPPNERWCELAVTVYALKDRRDEAERIVNWAAAQQDRAKYGQCVIRLADALFVRSLSGQEKGRDIRPQDLSPQEREALGAVLSTLQPVLDPIVGAGQVDSGLASTAVKIAWLVHYLLGSREKVAELARLMYTYRPVPVDVARSVVHGYIEPPSDLPERLREDHPSDLEANILAALVQSSFMGQHSEGFAKAKELIPRRHSCKEGTALHAFPPDVAGVRRRCPC